MMTMFEFLNLQTFVIPLVVFVFMFGAGSRFVSFIRKDDNNG